MLTAKQARELATSYYNIKLDMALKHIEDKAREGHLSCRFEEYMEDQVKYELEALGYHVYPSMGQTGVHWEC